MEATLDWRGCFNVPTLSELKNIRESSVVLQKVDGNSDSTAESTVVSQRSKVLKSVVFILKTASVTCAVLTLAPIVGGVIGSTLGIATGHAMAASTSLAGATYAVGGSHTVVAAMAPVATTAAQATGWKTLIDKVLWIVDYLMDGVIIFSGISWMFGNRTKAIELLLGAGVGYVIVRHHEDIKHFFQLL